MGKIRAATKRKRWTAAEIALLRKHYATASRREVARLFPDRPIRAVECKANGLGLRRPKRQARTPDEVRKAKRDDMARRRAADPVAAREYRNRYHAENREAQINRMRAYTARRFFWARANRLNGVTAKDLAALWRQQRGLCALTGRKLDRSAEVDHIVPRARGGGDLISNLRWVCRDANRAKRDLTDEEFGALCADVMRWIGRRVQMIESLTE